MKLRSISILVISWLFTSIVFAQPVTFNDENLKQCVIDALASLNPPINTSDPTQADMLELTDISCNGAGISDLAGLGYATNLTSITMGNNPIDNISELSNLNKLTNVRMSYCQFSDLSPLTNLTSLVEIRMQNYEKIESCEPLSGLTELRELDLSGGKIENISCLTNLTNLKLLWMDNNPIINYAPIANLMNLEETSFGNTGLDSSDLIHFSGLTNLWNLSLANNNITDISALSGLFNLKYLVLYYNQIEDISPLLGMTKLRRVRLISNPLMPPACEEYIPQIWENNPNLEFLTHDLGDCTCENELTITSSEGGEVTTPYEGTKTHYFCNKPVNLEANPDPGYHFVNWTGDADTIVDVNSHSTTITLIGNPGSYSIKAIFKKAVPDVSTYPAEDIACTSAVLNGFLIDDSGQSTECQFVYWAEGADHQFTPWQPGLQSNASFKSLVTDLQPNTNYTFYAEAKNSNGTDTGSPKTFVTLDCDLTAALIYVDDDGPNDPVPFDSSVSDPNEDGSEEHPFDMIQEGINDANDGDTVYVLPGTYYETIDPMGKNITVTGFDPSTGSNSAELVMEGLFAGFEEESGITPYPVIDANDTGTVVTFSQEEDPNCVLSGFVITRGYGDKAGAILCHGASPSIDHCLIVGNRSLDPNGGAIYLQDSNSVWVNVSITDNAGLNGGAGVSLINSHPVISSSILWNNNPIEILLLDMSAPNVTYSTVADMWPGTGNLSEDPLFVSPGLWVDKNDSSTILNPTDSNAVWLDGDYHLMSEVGRWDPNTETWTINNATSPAIDAGNPESDWNLEPIPNGERINQGAYGGTNQASKSSTE